MSKITGILIKDAYNCRKWVWGGGTQLPYSYQARGEVLSTRKKLKKSYND